MSDVTEQGPCPAGGSHEATTRSGSMPEPAAAADGRYVYHLVPDDLQGEVLYPLHTLRAVHPMTYARERRKYQGRESVLTFRVPFLDVTWGETVNLSALDPRHLVTARRQRGITRSRLLARRLVRIPIGRIACQPAVIYDPVTHWANTAPGEDRASTPPPHEFARFDPSSYKEAVEVPARHLDYLEAQVARKGMPLGFAFVRHVLVAGPVDIHGLDLIPL